MMRKFKIDHKAIAVMIAWGLFTHPSFSNGIGIKHITSKKLYDWALERAIYAIKNGNICPYDDDILSVTKGKKEDCYFYISRSLEEFINNGTDILPGGLSLKDIEKIFSIMKDFSSFLTSVNQKHFIDNPFEYYGDYNVEKNIFTKEDED